MTDKQLPLSEVLDELERRYGVDDVEQTDEEIEWALIMHEAQHNQ
jgi:hypothetical protein